MPTRGTEGLNGAVRRVAGHARTLASLEVELARRELQRKLALLGVGVALLAVAGLLALIALVLVFAGVAAAFALVLPEWAGWLVSAGVALLVGVVLAGAGLGALRRTSPPVPEQAIQEAKLTAEALRGHGPS